MSHTRFAVALLLAAWLVGSVGGVALAKEPAPAPASQAAGVPKSVIDQIEAQFKLPTRQLGREEMRKLLEQRVTKILELGAEAEKKHPKAPNLHLVRTAMLQAADYLATTKKDRASAKRLLDIAGRIMASAAPLATKIRADAAITKEKLIPTVGDPVKDVPGEIRAFIRRYAKTDAAALAAVQGTYLALQSRQSKLAEELVGVLAAKYVDNAMAKRLLRRMGKHPDVGRPFAAELTRLDGTKLSLPKDLLGKVVVVDFWATWCPSCVEEIPHMVAAYRKYKPKGVEFVGISLDRAGKKAELEKFVKDNGMSWVHTYSGKFWSDPTVRKYGVGGIPSIWVVGKDGKVVSDAARGKLERVIEGALKAPAAPKGP